MSIHQDFSPELLAFLKQEGYTHIQNIGNMDSNDDIYLLRPLKSDDPRLIFEETDHEIERITDDDVAEMAHGDQFISFMIEMPSVDLEKFLKQ